MNTRNTIRVGLGDSLTVTTKYNKKGDNPVVVYIAPLLIFFFFWPGRSPDLVLRSRLKCEKLVVSLRKSNMRVN